MASSSPRSKVVVVVEDDAAIRMMLARGLGLAYVVHECEDGQKAQELLSRIEPPAAIVCDIAMPLLDGLALVKWLKTQPALANVPVLLLTARDGTDDVVRGINAGARHYLAKPFKLRELVDKVTAMVGKKR